jgi:hypothetical protein
MRSVTSIRTMLQRFGFSDDAATYFTSTCGIDSLDEIAYLDGVDDVDTTIKGVTNPGGTVTTGEGTSRVTSRSNGIPVSIRVVDNLKLCVYYLQHMESVKLLPLPQPPVRARTDARTNPSAQRATQLRSVLARV